MTPFSFDGTYADARGSEAIKWTVRESDCATPLGHGPRFDIHTTIRGVAVWGYDFDGLEPVEMDDVSNERLSLGAESRELDECILTGDLPCVVDGTGTSIAATVRFRLTLGQAARSNVAAPRNLQLTLELDSGVFQVQDDWFEGGMLQLNASLPEGTSLRCCVTCLYSDYSPGGHGLIGMACHRDAKEQYLAVRSKLDYWSVPVTEDVLETYVCPEYERRRPGTGYRG
jgi:hypothetical protein